MTIYRRGIPPAVGVNPSGQAPPSGDLPGWHLEFAEDFNTDTAVGSWGPLAANVPAAYSAHFTVYEDGWLDTAASIEDNGSRYMPTEVLSTSNSCLRKHLFNSGSGARSASLSCFKNIINYGQPSVRVTARLHADSLHGFKTAWLLWPDSEVWPRDGEIDIPEGTLNSTVSAFMHRQDAVSGSDQDAFFSSTTYTSWHTYTIEHISGTSCKFFIDGVQLGSTITSRVPNTSMHWVLQTESDFPGAAAQPAVGTTGYLEVDWVALWTAI